MKTKKRTVKKAGRVGKKSNPTSVGSYGWAQKEALSLRIASDRVVTLSKELHEAQLRIGKMVALMLWHGYAPDGSALGPTTEQFVRDILKQRGFDPGAVSL